MSENYTLKYTNCFTYPYNFFKQDAERLTVKGNCLITNYDTEKQDGSAKGAITVEMVFGEVSIQEGTGNGHSKNLSEADFSNKKFSIFSAIASLDGKKELSVDDLKYLDESFAEKYGLKDVKLLSNKVAILTWGKDDILRLDFSSDIRSSNIDYVVQSGDSVAKIAKKFGLARWQLTQANEGLEDKKYIHQGDTLVIPPQRKLKSYKDLSSDSKEFLKKLAKKESSNIKTKENKKTHYIGLYQIGEKAFESLGVYKEKKSKATNVNDWQRDAWVKNNQFNIKSKEDFLNNEQKQHKAIIELMRRNWIELKDYRKYIGKTFTVTETYKGKTSTHEIEITASGLLAGAHLVGPERIKDFLNSKGKTNPVDGNQKSVSVYIRELAGYNVESIIKD